MNEANIGIDLGGTKLLIICKKEQCRVESGPDFSPQMMETAIRDFLNERDINPTGIGIAIPGFVDRSGNVGYWPTIWDVRAERAHLLMIRINYLYIARNIFPQYGTFVQNVHIL